MITAARAGVRGAENIERLAEAGLILSKRSLDIGPQEATEGLAILARNMDISIEKAGLLGNVINVLSDNNAALSGQITTTSQRLAGFAGQLGIQAEELTALSATLISTGATATTIRSTFVNLFKASINRFSFFIY